MSNINGSIELPYDFEFTSKFSILNFSCIDKIKSFTKDCRVFVSIVTSI